MNDFDRIAARVRIVLVNTQHGGNVGSAARAMKTMGLRRLVLVAPAEFPSQEASWLAVHAADLLAEAVVVDSVADAVRDCALVIGTSVRLRRFALPVLVPREAEQLVLDMTRQSDQAQIAIVFGRESSGLTEDELLSCNRQVSIPADPAYSSLNLAMAVQILCYELHLAARAAGLSTGLAAGADGAQPAVPLAAAAVAATTPAVQELDPPATLHDLQNLLGHAASTFTAVGYHVPERPRHLLPRLRRLFGRAGMLASEVRLLRGALSAIDAALTHRTPAQSRTRGAHALTHAQALLSGADARGNSTPSESTTDQPNSGSS